MNPTLILIAIVAPFVVVAASMALAELITRPSAEKHWHWPHKERGRRHG